MTPKRHPFSSMVRMLVVGLVPFWLAACGSSSNGGESGSGGKAGSGGSVGSGGAIGSGGQGTGGTGSGGQGSGGKGTGGSGSGGNGAGGNGTVQRDAGDEGSGGKGTGGRDAGGTLDIGAGGRGTGGAGTGGTSGGMDGGSSAGCPASATLKAGSTKKTIKVGSLDRTYTVYAPTSYTGKSSVPLVFDFHGMGSNGSQQKSLSGWDKLADKQGFIVVYGDGSGNSWNAGGCCPSASTDKIDDVGFVKAVITALATEACIDVKRVYASGCSNGGAMSFRLACDAADVVAAVAPVDFDTVATPCKPSRPITEIQFRATKDQMVDYKGAEPNFKNWGTLNQCTGSPAPLAGHSTCQAYPSCAQEAETILCTVTDGTHCGNYSTFQIPAVAWEVLQHHTLP
jgi:polyhydroxybutyrate depolymerase